MSDDSSPDTEGLFEAHCQRAGTVTVPASSVCALCRKPNPDVAIRHKNGDRPYHRACVEQELKKSAGKMKEQGPWPYI